jgi:hypothetical protein
LDAGDEREDEARARDGSIASKGVDCAQPNAGDEQERIRGGVNDRRQYGELVANEQVRGGTDENGRRRHDQRDPTNTSH